MEQESGEETWRDVQWQVAREEPRDLGQALAQDRKGAWQPLPSPGPITCA